MKKILSFLLTVCVVLGCTRVVAAASLDSELVGLWQFERSDNLDDDDFASYVEYNRPEVAIIKVVPALSE